MNKRNLIIGLVVVLVIAIIGLYFFRNSGGKVGAAITSNLPSMGLANLAVGSGCDTSYGTCTGTNLNRVNAGTCYLAPYATTIAATTTSAVDCQGTLAWNASSADGRTALTGVTFGDSVIAMLSTTTAKLGNPLGLILAGASASTTAGHIELQIRNNTGTTFTWSTVLGTASGTVSYLVTN